MKINYNKKRLRYNLYIGIAYIIIGIASIINDSTFTFNYFWLFMGLFHFSFYLFENTKQYAQIENGMLVKNQLFPKKIVMNEIKSVRKFAGDYIFKTESKELRLSKDMMHAESMLDLDKEIEKLALNKPL